ncbi:carboxypeptidase B [Eurytemora carolleeae]|uniref:carboxypeptidase B n=1 Tax=Eurytemora carolleeae TaxID=1294199 RepID=UPI000C775DEA|nr:carboxypeptidase B [Eurytemora carolleeae]|eukprot:XP_023337842.1 carboxypeptidase B-like [Eurytemora affinis]
MILYLILLLHEPLEYVQAESVNYSNHQFFNVFCDLQNSRLFSADNDCVILKEYKLYSKLLCDEKINTKQAGDCNVRREENKIGSKEEDERRRRREVKRESMNPGFLDFSNRLFPGEYHRYAEIEKYLKKMAAKFPQFFSLEDLERTHENRSIYLVKIGTSRLGSETPTALVDGGMHAREWITPATALQLIFNLISVFKADKDSCMDPLQSMDWYIIPLLNPDGYEYSHTSDRYWRKNMRPAPLGSDCPGVDINRNFPLGYGLGADSNPCSEVYMGTEALSEPESKSLFNIVHRLNKTLVFYTSLHAFGQSWLMPYGYIADRIPEYERFEWLAKQSFKQMDCRFGEQVPSREWEVGGAAEIYYIAGGASDDWVYNITGAVSYTIELPDDGRSYAFELPASSVEEVSTDIWNALRHLALNILSGK